MITGNNAKLQIGVEEAYGSSAVTTQEIKFLSESLRKNLNKKDEGVLTGGRATSAVATMSKNTSGNISILARPDDIGYIIGCALGVETTPSLIAPSMTAYRHTFKALNVSDTSRLPSLTVKIDRIASVYTYSGIKIDSLSISAQPEDFLKLDIALVGKEETTGGSLSTLTSSTLKALRFAWGTVTFNGSTVGDITSIKFNYNNNLVKNIQTTSTGFYFYEPDPAARDVQIEFETLFNSAFATFNNVYDNDNAVEVVLTFTSDDQADSENNIPYKLIITIPNAQVIDAVANIGGADAVKGTVKAKAVEIGTDELIIVELDNLKSTKYI